MVCTDAALGPWALGGQGQAEPTPGASPAPVAGRWKDTGGLEPGPVLKPPEELGWVLKPEEELGWENQSLTKPGPGLPLGPVPGAPGNTTPLFATWPAPGALPVLSPKTPTLQKAWPPLPFPQPC